jgi:large subunit ribosomal protein L22
MATNGVTPEFRAQARWVRTTPRKAQLVVSEIRGKSVPEAQTLLAFMTRAAARDVEKVLGSAVANAESHPADSYTADQLYVLAAYVGNGPILKRWRARARGRVGRIKKRTCHITIRLAPLEGAVARPVPVEERPKRARRKPAEATAAEAPALEAPAEEPAAVEVPVEEAPVEEAPAEEKLKRTRTRKKAEEPAAVEVPVEEAPVEEAPVEEKPKRTRTRKKADEPKAAEEAPDGEKEE